MFAKPSEEVLQGLIVELKSASPDRRRAAARVLGQYAYRAAAAAPALVETLHDADAWVRLEAGTALQQMHKAAVPLLTTALRDEEDDEDYRRSAAVTLGHMGRCADTALASLVQTYQAAGTSNDLRIVIIEALGRLGPLAGSTIPLLMDALKVDVLAAAATEALRHVKKGPWETFLAALHEGARLLVITMIVATVFGTIISIFGRLEIALFPTAGGIGLAAACACGMLMSRMSRLTATESWSRFASFMWMLVLCVGGCSFGLVLGGLFGAVLQPIAESLGR